MNNLTQKILDIQHHDGTQNTLIPGVFTFVSSASEKAEPLLYNTSMVFITSGSKNLYLEDKTYSYGKGKFLFVSLPTPFICEALPGEDNIFAGLTILVDKEDILSLVHEIKFKKHQISKEISVGVISLDVNKRIENALSRLLDCSIDDNEAKILGTMIKREILFYALQEPGALNLCDNILNNSFISPLSSLITEINNNYHKDITVEGLAKDMNMSGATFYRHFKAYTGYSPIQYLKNLRLNKARDYLSIYGLSVKETSGKVGYNSISQFSREYKKYFGHTPTAKLTI